MGEARLVMVFVAALALQGCSCNGDMGGGPRRGAACEGDVPMAGCGVPCGEGQPACPTGLYCGDDGTCTADCTADGAVSCGRGWRCTAWGSCVEDPRANDIDAANICADVMVESRRVTPRVVLIIDQSASMHDDFGGETRWNVLRESLLADDGLIRALEDQVEFGLALYSAVSGGDGLPEDPDMCPLITWVDPALNNYGSIAAEYAPAEPIDDTPTGDAIYSVLDRIRGVPDPDTDPTIFVVATDGEPDMCEELDPQNGHEKSIMATEAAHASGIDSYIISVGREITEDHLQDMANAGVGHGAGDPDAPFWVVGDDAGLRDALRAIVSGILSCRVDLDGTIDTEVACTGTVRLNGRSIACEDPDGWRVVDENTIELQGEACAELQEGTGATLEASFPCDVVLI